MIVRRAHSGEGASVVGLIRELLGGPLCSMTIWRSPRADRYVEQQLRQASESAFYLLAPSGKRATGKSEALGVAALRFLRCGVFLNHIYLRPEARGRGLGRALLRQAAEDLCKDRAAPKILLDVDSANDRARAWYERLGFVCAGEIFWQRGAVRQTKSSPGRILEWRKAQQTHRRFGFSEFAVETPRGRYPAGRLWTGYFRLKTLKGRQDPALHAALHRLDPARQILLIDPVRQAGLQVVRRAWRMQADPGELLERLR